MNADDFKGLRKRKGLKTQKETAEFLEVSLSAVQKWDQGIRRIPNYAIRLIRRRPVVSDSLSS